MSESFPLDAICATFPNDVDQRIDVSHQSCFGGMRLGIAQARYNSEQFNEPHADLELAANAPGMTALMQASLQNDIGAVRILLRRGASVGLVNGYGRTALILAAMAGNEEIVKLLLSVDVPTDVTDHWGRDAVAWADGRNHKKVAILIRAAAHARRDWRMAQLKERENQRALHQRDGSPTPPEPSSIAGGSMEASARYAPASSGSGASPPSGKRSSRQASGRTGSGPGYSQATTSARQGAVDRAAQRGKIGPIGLGVLSARGKKAPASKGELAIAEGKARSIFPSSARGILSTTTSGLQRRARGGFLSGRLRGEPRGGGSATDGSTGGWFSGLLGRSSPSPSDGASPLNSTPGVVSAKQAAMQDEGTVAGSADESVWLGGRPGDRTDASARGGAKSSVRGSARSALSSVRSAVFSSRSVPGFVSTLAPGARAAAQMGRQQHLFGMYSTSTNPGLDAFLAQDRAEATQAHGGAQSDRGGALALGLSSIAPEDAVAAMKRRRDRAWEEKLYRRHERRVSPDEVRKYQSSKRRAWINSSRRWIERRKQLAEEMTPKERKLSRARLYTTPRHYKANQPRVYA